MRLNFRVFLWCALALVALAGCGDSNNNNSSNIVPDNNDVPDAFDDVGDDGDVVDDATEDEDDGPPPDPNIIRVRFDPGAEGFYRMPWPSDARLTPDGTPDLEDFPGRDTVVDSFVEELGLSVGGYATMPIIYVGLETFIRDSSLPQGNDATAPESPVQLIDLSEEGCGRRYPLDMAINLQSDRFNEPGTLQVKNSIGTVLDPGSPYGLVVLKSLGEAEGKSTERPEGFDQALNGSGDPVSDSLEPLRRCLPQTGVELDDVAVATVFTPHDPAVEMKVLRDFVMDPEAVETRGPLDWEESHAWSRDNLDLVTYRAHVEMPIFQNGDSPYTNAGGRLTFDDQGQPVIQRWEEVEVAVSMRVFEEPFEGPRPVLVFLDGTGWGPWTHLYDNWIVRALNNGYIIFSFMPQFHGGRGGFGGSTELSTFNFINPAAGRSNFRQQAAEASYFIRLIREQLDGQEGLPELDTERMVYGGHSQGALVGSIVAAVETEYEAYVLNGLSSYLTLTLLFRKDIVDFELVVRSVFNVDSIDIYSPVIQLLQLGAEVVDPHNYARLWRGWEGNPAGNHVFVINGLNDSTTTPRGMEHLTITADLPPLDPPGWDVDPEGVWDGQPVALPVTGNVESSEGEPLTIATFLDGDQGHFTIYRRDYVRQMAVDFWNSAREEGVPTLRTIIEYRCDDGEDGDGDGDIDCDDSDCADIRPCAEEICDDGEDGDGDGLVDCEDDQCQGTNACREFACDDGEDNDFDGAIDCDDSNCANVVPCGEQRCGDGEDGDNDGLIDCEDDQCARSELCVERNCVDGRDSDSDGLIDCADPDCIGSVACPEVDCSDGEDNNDNGFIDCDDFGCAGTEACPIFQELVCDDEDDDDEDGLTDCNDPDCGLAPECEDDVCADIDLGSAIGAPVYVGTLEGAENNYPPGECVPLGRGDDTPDLAFRWTPPEAGDYFISTYNSEIDTVLSLYRAGCDDAEEFGCDDDDGPLDTSAVVLRVGEGVSVDLIVSGYTEMDAGAIQLHIIPLP